MVLTALPEFHALPPARRLLLGYEALCADPVAEIDRLARFTGVDVAPDWLECAAHVPEKRPSRWQDLPPDARRALSAGTEAARVALAGLSVGERYSVETRIASTRRFRVRPSSLWFDAIGAR
ncbi:MAG TPA: hypothetical protein DIU07_14475 [Rhodobacteraceae bacterium]|nr:hypothetical protein [Paracoccaceae bacterium]